MKNYAWQLRTELADRARSYALDCSLPHSLSYADDPVVCFEPFGDSRHGNFHRASYHAIQGHPQWRRRLAKVHTTARRTLPASDCGRRRELDLCTSSDALLMNVFCHPTARRSTRVAALLGVGVDLSPEFGFRARVPLVNGRSDRTEVDMQLAELLVEAKLTEGDFQRASKPRLELYRDFTRVFDPRQLPQISGFYISYQLIRNVLAAYARGCSFCTLLDARRPDLVEAWYATIGCVRLVDLRTRCKILTWQELSWTLPNALRSFLAVKYGIASSQNSHWTPGG